MAESSTNEKLRILLVEDNKDFAKLVQVYLQRFAKDKFEVVWKENHDEAIHEVEGGSAYDIILMDYFLPGKNGLEITRELIARKLGVPIVFLTVNKDFDLALDVMKLGVSDYLVKEEISSPVLPATILSVIEKHRLKNQLSKLEVSRHRLSAIHETLSRVVHEFEVPIGEMTALAGKFKETILEEPNAKFVKIIDENVKRMADKLEKLKTLKEDRTVKYIKDIKMIDLS
jgi:DNA-binding response OmpR family regulator